MRYLLGSSWLVMFSLRAACVYLFVSRAVREYDLACAFWAAVESQALYCAALNFFHRVRTDHGFPSLAIVAAYFFGASFSLEGAGTLAGSGLLMLCSAFSFWARMHLGRSYTVGGSTWVRLCDSGPYARCRHPLLAAQVLARVAICISFPSLLNAALGAAFIASCLVVVFCEERFLMSEPVYAAYARRVPARLLPGVF